jgi:hypothetical protein
MCATGSTKGVLTSPRIEPNLVSRIKSTRTIIGAHTAYFDVISSTTAITSLDIPQACACGVNLSCENRKHRQG